MAIRSHWTVIGMPDFKSWTCSSSTIQNLLSFLSLLARTVYQTANNRKAFEHSTESPMQLIYIRYADSSANLALAFQRRQIKVCALLNQNMPIKRSRLKGFVVNGWTVTFFFGFVDNQPVDNWCVLYCGVPGSVSGCKMLLFSENLDQNTAWRSNLEGLLGIQSLNANRYGSMMHHAFFGKHGSYRSVVIWQEKAEKRTDIL